MLNENAVNQEVEVFEYFVISDGALVYVVFEDDMDEVYEGIFDRDVGVKKILVPAWLEEVIGTDTLESILCEMEDDI